MLGSYIIISPVRNEAAYLGRTLKSVIDQSHRPAEWIIVDDGSTDRTTDLVEEAAQDHPWIKLVRRTDRGRREPGRGVVEAFSYGLERRQLQDPDFVSKMDGDLEFGPEYFETLLHEFNANSKLGMASGNTYLECEDGSLVMEKAAPGFVVGPIKLYRWTCFQEIGGLVPHLGWDTIDVYKARMHGWTTRNYPQLRVNHLRAMGTAKGIIWGKMRTGRGDYYAGTHPLFAAVRSIYRMGDRPFFLNGLSIGLGYLQAYLERAERIDDQTFISYLRRDQMSRLKEMFSLKRHRHESKQSPSAAAGYEILESSSF